MTSGGWYLTVLLCLPLLDGTALCSPRLAGVAPSLRACLIHEANMILLQPGAPSGHRYDRARNACTRTRPDWPELPASVPAWRFA